MIFRNACFFSMILALSVISSCSELLQKIPGPLVDKGSLIVVDEANQVFYALNTNSNSVKLVGYFPTTTANDVETDGSSAYFVISSPLASPTEGNKLIRYNLSNGVWDVLSFPSDSNPYNLALDADKIYVTLSKSNMLAIVDKANFTLMSLMTLPWPGQPYGLATDSDYVYIATSIGYISWGNPGNYSNSMIVRYRKSDETVTNFPVWTNPQSLALGNGYLFVAAVSDYSGSGRIQAVNLLTFEVSNLSLPATAPTFVKFFNQKLFVMDASYGGSGGVFIYVLSNGQTTSLLTGTDLKGMDFAGDTAYLTTGYLGSAYYQIDLNDLSVRTNPGLGGGDCAFYR